MGHPKLLLPNGERGCLRVHVPRRDRCRKRPGIRGQRPLCHRTGYRPLHGRCGARLGPNVRFSRVANQRHQYPYTDDVARGSARMFVFLASQTNVTNTYYYNPATVNYGCSDGSQVQLNGNCLGTATRVYYNSGATSCMSPNCTFTFDGNTNGQMIYSSDGSGEPIYTGGPFMDALVASGTPGATAPTGGSGVLGATYKDVVQDMTDWYSACQYGYDYDPGNGYSGYTRGGGYSAQGGGWVDGRQPGDD